jgi:SAM-dependent methyltransferase
LISGSRRHAKIHDGRDFPLGESSLDMKLCLQCQTRFEAADWRCPACHRQPAVIDGYPAFDPELAAVNDGAPVDAHERLDRIQEQSFWFRGRNRLIRHFVRRHFMQARAVLEVGCGTGFVTSAIRASLPSARLTASEIYSYGLRYAENRVAPPCEFLQMDARHIPFVDEFDMIGAFDVLEHIEDDQAVLARIRDALKPGGSVLLTVPQHPWLWSATDDLGHHKRRYRRHELAAKLERAGFSISRKTSFMSLLLPIMLLQRCMAGGKESYDADRELRLPVMVDRLFEAVMSLERWIIASGVNLPIGGSQLVIARKPL